ncbi:MAG: flagellar biosynthesis protein FlgA [Aldersonia sp.]|nr:flagellar biosynthesis protein FlgA [Aldersonia sp.]
MARPSSAGRGLAPTLVDRLTGLSRPHWARTALARRIVAAALALTAVALAFLTDPATDRTVVAVAARDLPSGKLLDAGDVRMLDHDSGSIPDGAIDDAALAIGHTLAGAVRSGEVFTDARVMGPRLAVLATGAADARIVPIRPADPAVAGLLREGDRVDIVAADESSPMAEPNPAADESSGHEHAGARTLARDAAVVMVSQTAGERAAERVVMVAMPQQQAAAVAAASLSNALTVVFR